MQFGLPRRKCDPVWMADAEESAQVEAIGVHDLAPGGDEVLKKHRAKPLISFKNLSEPARTGSIDHLLAKFFANTCGRNRISD